MVAEAAAAKVLRSVSNPSKTLARVLRSFVNNYAQGAPDLLALDGPELLPRWRPLRHSLHGACSTIAATSMDQGWVEFERQIKSIDADPGQLERPIRSLMPALVPALPTVLSPRA